MKTQRNSGDVEKSEPAYPAGAHVKGEAPLENRLAVSQNVKDSSHELINPRNPSARYITKRNENIQSHKKLLRE